MLPFFRLHKIKVFFPRILSEKKKGICKFCALSEKYTFSLFTGIWVETLDSDSKINVFDGNPAPYYY
jgi:hypothetical protein